MPMLLFYGPLCMYYTVCAIFGQNEETLKKCVSDYQGKMKKLEESYRALRKQAEEKLNV